MDKIIDNSKTLTVVVLNEKGEPTQDADVSITPSDASGVTNNSGEIQFTLGNAVKYDITATADGKTVTVPYYVTKGGATRLVINPVYVRSVEKQLNPSFFNSNLVSTVSIGLGIIIFLIILYKLFRHRK